MKRLFSTAHNSEVQWMKETDEWIESLEAVLEKKGTPSSFLCCSVFRYGILSNSKHTGAAAIRQRLQKSSPSLHALCALFVPMAVSQGCLLVL
eukprot:361741-Amphidinium_carterae.1